MAGNAVLYFAQEHPNFNPFKKETFAGDSTQQQPPAVQQESSTFPIWQVVSLLCSIYAAWLSWECNVGESQSGKMSGFEHVFRALVAFFFGLLYLIVYLFFYKTECQLKSIKHRK
jgi:hypothetical protein